LTPPLDRFPRPVGLLLGGARSSQASPGRLPQVAFVVFGCLLRPYPTNLNLPGSVACARSRKAVVGRDPRPCGYIAGNSSRSPSCPPPGDSSPRTASA
jgi:hypothetical protein